MNELGKWLRQHMKQRALTQGKVVMLTGLAKSTVSKIVHDGKVEAETVQKLAWGLKVDERSLLELARLATPRLGKTPDEWSPEFMELAAWFDQLSEKERLLVHQNFRTLREFVESQRE